MNLGWLLRRIRAMSLMELASRAFTQLRFSWLRCFTEPIQVHGQVGLCFGFCLDTDFPDPVRKMIILKADQILSGRFECFGREVSLDAHPRWHMDPLSKKAWPQDYFLDIDYRAADAPGDPKIIWEINRHQYLVLAALAFTWTGRTDYREFVIHEIRGWIRGNPALRGINWVSSMEVGIRLLSWVMALSVLGRDQLGNDVQEAIAKSMLVQLRFVFMNQSRYSSANNHLIGEVAGALAAALFLDFEDAGHMADKAIRILQQQVTRQFYPDGVCREQSVNYQCHTMDYYMVAENLCRRVGKTLGPSVLERISAALAFLTDLGGDDGTCPNLGDEDEGFVARVLGETERTGSTLAMAETLSGLASCVDVPAWDSRSILFRKAAAAGKTSSAETSAPGREIIMEMDESDVDSFLSVKPANGNRTQDDNKWRIFPYGGYAICRFRSPGISANLMFDFGPIGQAPLRAHGHADLLSICVSVNGKPFVADPGTFLYYGEDGWRQYFRSTAAHNTACVENRNQLQSLGRFQWGPEPHVKWENPNPHTIKASHDGYLRESGALHERTVMQEGQEIRVRDCITSPRSGHPVSYRIRFHLHPDTTVEQLSQNRFLLVNKGERIAMQFQKDANVILSEGGTVNPMEGWFSRVFYQKEPSMVFIIDGNSETSPVQDVRLIILGKNHDPHLIWET